MRAASAAVIPATASDILDDLIRRHFLGFLLRALTDFAQDRAAEKNVVAKQPAIAGPTKTGYFILLSH